MYGGVGGRINLALVLGAGLLIGSAPARAADLGGDCCADLEERIAELEATTARKGNRKVSLTVSGYINEAVLYWNDGHESNVYQGTNDAARGRFRFLGDAKINKEWSAGYLLEIGVRSNRLNRTDQNHSRGFSTVGGVEVDAGGLDIRQSTWWIQSTRFGRIWLGQTDQTTERITEINLSATNLFLKHYGRWNSSFRLYAPNGTLSNNTWGQILPQSGFTGEGVPGEGDRWNLIKYESPEFGGFVASAAWGDDDFWDVAVRYAAEHAGFKLAGGIGYAAWVGQGPLNSRGCSIAPNGKSDCETLGLSGSIMHVETGLYFTGAYGIKWDNNREAAFHAITATDGKIDDSDSFYSLMLGVERKFGHLGTLGKSTIYAEYEHYDTGGIIAGNGASATAAPRSLTSLFAVPAPFYGAGADIDVWGAGLNQNIEAASMDLYLAWRHAEGNVFGSTNGSKGGLGARTVDIEAMDMIMGGSRIQF
jgi:predicted porin